MDFSNKFLLTTLLAGLASATTTASRGETVEVLTLGDSITYGSNSDSSGEANPDSPNDNLGGYRFYLDRLLGSDVDLAGTDFDFVGGRTHGSGISGGTSFSDNQHFGVKGARASVDNTGDLDDGDGTLIPSMLTGINNAGPSPSDPINAAFDTTVTNPDAVLLGIGINSLPRRGGDLSGGDDQTIAQMQARLDTKIADAVGEFRTLLDGDGTRTGLADRLGDSSYFANDAHLFVALIIPRLDADKFSSGTGERDIFLKERQAAMVADYNHQVKNELLSRMGPGGSLEGKVTFVDQFSITLGELDLDALATEFFSGEVDPMQALLDAINPESETGTNETDYVDWAYNPSEGFNEGLYDEGTLPGSDDLLNVAGNNSNTFLLDDKLHPTNLGYAINAQIWENAIKAHYVPEPGSMALLFGGGMLLLSRHRRRAV